MMFYFFVFLMDFKLVLILDLLAIPLGVKPEDNRVFKSTC
jgi:hypothetical protein